MRGFAFSGAILAMWLAFAPKAHAQWVAVETPGFTVYADSSERRASEMALNLERFDGLLRRMTGAPTERSPARLQVYLFGTNDFEAAFPHFENTNVAGVYYAQTERVAAYSIFSPNSGLGSQDVLFHEYAHHFMYQYFNNAYPSWYIEGFAEVASTAVLGTERIIIGRSNPGRARDLLSNTWLPMDRLLTMTTRQFRDPRESAMFYAQSWLFAQYLLLTPSANTQFQAYVRAIRSGRPPLEAFQEGFGVTPDQMQATLRRYLQGNPSAIALTQPAYVVPPRMDVTELPASARRLLPTSTRLFNGNVADEDKAPLLARIRQLAGAEPYDEFALLTVARAEIRLGSPATGRALLEPYVTANPNNRDALYLMGLSYLREANDAEGDAEDALLAQARRYFSRGYRIDGNHVPTLARYAESYSGTAMSETTYENYLNILLLARQLAPQVDEISLNAANMLLASDRAREAIPILRALAYDPHAGGSAEVAQRLLAEAETRLAGETVN